jgi:hypothetical protein
MLRCVEGFNSGVKRLTGHYIHEHHQTILSLWEGYERWYPYRKRIKTIAVKVDGFNYSVTADRCVQNWQVITTGLNKR